MAPGRIVVWESGRTHVLTLPPTPGPPGGSGLVTTATMPMLALDRMLTEGEARSGDTALLIAFGAGLAYAAQVVVVP